MDNVCFSIVNAWAKDIMVENGLSPDKEHLRP